MTNEEKREMIKALLDMLYSETHEETYGWKSVFRSAWKKLRSALNNQESSVE